MKYCKNCGTELKEGADICLGCGTLLKQENQIEKKETTVSGKSITSLILGVIATLWTLLSLLSIEEAKYAYWFEVGEENVATFIGFYIGYTLLSLTPSIVGLILGLLGLKDKSKGISIAGLVLSGFALLSCIVILIIFIATF